MQFALRMDVSNYAGGCELWTRDGFPRWVEAKSNAKLGFLCREIEKVLLPYCCALKALVHP